MLSCKQASQLMSQAQDRNLTLKERVPLKLHLFICAGCTHYNQQMDLLHKAMQKYRQV